MSNSTAFLCDFLLVLPFISRDDTSVMDLHTKKCVKLLPSGRGMGMPGRSAMGNKPLIVQALGRLGLLFLLLSALEHQASP